eukprot:5464543-Pyramimonas_sp.AAC.1
MTSRRAKTAPRWPDIAPREPKKPRGWPKRAPRAPTTAPPEAKLINVPMVFFTFSPFFGSQRPMTAQTASKMVP